MKATDSLLSHILDNMIEDTKDKKEIYDSVDDFFEIFPVTSQMIAFMTQKDIKLIHKQFKNK